MVGADESTELWRHPNIILNVFLTNPDHGARALVIGKTFHKCNSQNCTFSETRCRLLLFFSFLP